jgi:quercetin dioxygenase-like cupin family protein
MTVIRVEDLPFSAIAHELVGAEHGGVGVCILFVDAAPGQGPALHKHPYEEVFIVQEGRGPLRQVDVHVSPSFSTEWL